MTNDPSRLSDATRCVHAGEERHGTNQPLPTAIAQASVFVMPGLDELRRYAAGESSAYMYTRYGNPTVAAVEQKLAALEGAEACVAFSSGMAAQAATFMALCESGDEIVSVLDLYGGTVKLFDTVMPRMGIRTRLVPFDEIGAIEKCFTPKTRLLFLETPANPTNRCVDIAALSKLAHQHNAIVVADNTFATPILQKPLALGADIVVHSATKFLGGHNDVVAGAAIGPTKWLATIREMMKLTGGCLDPFAAYLLIRGLKTLEIRVERACANARQVSDFLNRHPKVERVHFPGLPDDANHALAARQMSAPGMMLAFDIRGGEPSASRFIDGLKLWYLATSLGGVESTVSYPLLSSHVGLTEKRLQQLGVSAGTIRLSVGIEAAPDLVADLEQALALA